MLKCLFIRGLYAGGVAAGLCIGVMLCGCVNNSQSDSAAQAANLKASRDAAVIHQAIQPALATDPELAEYLQLVGTRLVEGARQAGAKIPDGVQFYAAVSPVHNVISPGGPFIYITSGLIQQCQNEEDVAAALAHGLAHLIARHAQRRPPPDSTDPVALTLVMTSTPMSGSDEAQADRDGLQYFARAGWNPEKYPDILVRLGNRDLSRIQDLRQQASQLSRQAAAWRKSPVADDRSFPQLQQKAGLRGQTSDRAGYILAAFPSCFTPIDQAEQADARKRLAEMLPQPETHVHHGLGANQ
jgi:predicted Zn-dependent protease